MRARNEWSFWKIYERAQSCKAADELTADQRDGCGDGNGNEYGGRMVICHNLISDIWKNSAESLFWLWYSTTELSISPKMSKSGSFLFWCFHSAVNYDLLSICFKLQRPRNWCTWSIALAGTAALKFVSCIETILDALLFCISRDKLGRVINQKLSQALMK